MARGPVVAPALANEASYALGGQVRPARGMCRNLWTHRTKLLADYKPFQRALRVRFRDNEARSDHDLVVSLAI